MSDSGFYTVEAGHCDECGAPVAGVVVIGLAPDERVVCDPCAPDEPVFGVHVRPRRSRSELSP